jgi:hypothetical protein
MREEVYAQAPGASTFLGQTGEQWRCQSSTTPSRGSLERRIMLLPRGRGHILTQFRDKMEIPGNTRLSILLHGEPGVRKPCLQVYPQSHYRLCQ